VGAIDYINLAQNRDRWWALVYTVINLRVPQQAGNFWSILGCFSFSGRTLLHGVSYIHNTALHAFHVWKLKVISEWIFYADFKNAIYFPLSRLVSEVTGVNL
jgi:hypothetical protein